MFQEFLTNLYKLNLVNEVSDQKMCPPQIH